MASGTAWAWLEQAQAGQKYAENTLIIPDTEVCSEDQYFPVFVVYITRHSVFAGSGSWLCVGSQIGLI